MQPAHGTDAAIALLTGSTAYYLCCIAPNLGASHNAKGNIMTTRNAMSAIGSFFDVFGSAVAASRAVEAGRTPSARDLRTLGIDPAVFGKIVRR
jgi:hypothetical protein